MHDPKLLEVAGPAAEGAVFSVPTYDPTSTDPTVNKFVAAYRAKYGSEPDAFAATGYDSLRVLAEAIRLSNGKTPQEIQKGMTLVRNFPGPSGTVTFDRDGDVQKPLMLLTIQNGKFVPLLR